MTSRYRGLLECSAYYREDEKKYWQEIWAHTSCCLLERKGLPPCQKIVARQLTKRQKILKERKKRRDRRGGEDQEVEHCTSSTLGPPLMDGGMLGDRAR